MSIYQAEDWLSDVLKFLAVFAVYITFIRFAIWYIRKSLPSSPVVYSDHELEVEPENLDIRIVDEYCVMKWKPTSCELSALGDGGNVEVWMLGHDLSVSMVVVKKNVGNVSA